MAESRTQQVLEQAREVKREYEQGEERPLGSYLGLMAGYAAAATTAAVLLRKRRVPLPERVSWSDVALASLATHRVSRLLTKDPITSPLRAPFTRYDGVSGPAELKEEVRGHGPRHAIGELLTCPFCLAQWVATSFAVGLVAAPRATRMVASIFTTVAVADLLHLVYGKLES